MKKIIKILLVLISLTGIFLAVWGFLIEPNQLVVRNYNLKIRNWSPKLRGFKIVAISDIHGGSNFIDEAKIRRIVGLVNEQKPDIILLVGDYISEQHFDRAKLKMPLETVAESLKGLKASYGVYAVIGNHDNDYNNQAVQEALQKDGYNVLENAAVSIEKNGEKLRLLGMEDALRARSWDESKKEALAALGKLESDEGKIIIFTHNPDSVVYLSEDVQISPDAVLFLSGHTHGGQVRLPLIGAPIVPSTYGQKYAAGFIRENNIDMFVTTGIGTSIIPVRFGVPPEISVLNIEAK